jgi:hypothetical protein
MLLITVRMTTPRRILVRKGSVLWELVRNGETHPNGLVFFVFLKVHKPISLRTIQKLEIGVRQVGWSGKQVKGYKL